MSNGDMLKDIKTLIESGDDFTVKQYRILSLSGMVQLGDDIKTLRSEIQASESKAMTRVCPEVKQAAIDIKKLEDKSNRNDILVTLATAISGTIGFIFGGK